jgi:AcrR family transcriptional regulator
MPDIYPLENHSWYAKPSRYRHGSLATSALCRGREIVAAHGPAALTVRGLARELGVTPRAIRYWFRSQADLRAAVAERVAESVNRTLPDRTVASPRESLEKASSIWIDAAASEPNLYRLASGEGWVGPGLGWRGGAFAAPPPLTELRRRVDRILRSPARDRGRALPPSPKAILVSSVVHGLAMARIEGVPADRVEKAAGLLLDALLPA